MPQSYSSLHIHIVFSTKNREQCIDGELQSRLYEYIGGILRGTGSVLVSAGGTPDHIHLLTSLSRQGSIADLLRVVKTNSSKWVHETFAGRHDFAWQAGYGAFSIGNTELDRIKNYIASQEEHHRMISFKEEFRALLIEHDIPFDERYLWD